eukprot:TRINITY_DN2986_c1_g2_i1.p2 TRINITY_DN2986_c1_g2~~TRINITY_DN2986_c1_g2_i1.p2  ORF type:complete len:254 (-),score=-29.92 TRINITY_DN2986_c1_g2_i1:304-1065(-)
MRQQLAGAGPAPHVALEHAADEPFGLRRHAAPNVVREVQAAREHALARGVGAVAPERQHAREQHVQHHAQGPHVRRAAVVAGDYLRRHVERRPGRPAGGSVTSDGEREPKVSELHAQVRRRARAGRRDRRLTGVGAVVAVDAAGRVGSFLAEENILGLDVAMHDAARVAEGNCRSQLHEDVSRVALRELPAPHDLFEELAAVAYLRHQMYLPLVLEHRVKLHDPRVACHVAQKAHLPTDIFPAGLANDRGLRN